MQLQKQKGWGGEPSPTISSPPPQKNNAVSFLCTGVSGELISAPRCQSLEGEEGRERESSPEENVSSVTCQRGPSPEPLICSYFHIRRTNVLLSLTASAQADPVSTEIGLAFDLRNACQGGRKGRLLRCSAGSVGSPLQVCSPPPFSC